MQHLGFNKNIVVIDVEIRFFLTLYHTVLTFNNSKEKGFGKYCGKRRKCW